MTKQLLKLGVMGSIALGVVSCSDKVVENDKVDVRDVFVERLSPEMERVRDYVPPMAVMAHRGSTFWAPEETESAYRWAREMGADYLEADLQITKDGVILALHDDNLKRTTDIENIFGEDVPRTRKQYYIDIGYTEAEALQKYEADKASFQPNLTSYYTYEELLQLDAGSWFNQSNPEQARAAFATERQYISSLEDLVMYSKGKRLKRDANGRRIFAKGTRTGQTVSSLSGTADVVEYTFEYENDPAWGGNVPGIYVEFKEPWLNPADFEVRVYDELDRLGMNIITQPADAEPNYKNGLVNVGNANGKVILQTFSLESLQRVAQKFEGRVPMCLLLWKGTGATDIKRDDAIGYAAFVNLAVRNKAHIIGPSIAGAPNSYPELNLPWQDWLISQSGMLNHPYSFDTRDQMSKYYGDYNFGNASPELFDAPYFDGVFTNRTEMTLQFLVDKGIRESGAPHNVPAALDVLQKLGY